MARTRPSATAPRTLAARLAPRLRPASPAETIEKVGAWRREINRTAAGKALGRLIDASPSLAVLTEAIADGSPYLWELITIDPERWQSLLTSEPEARLAALLADTDRVVSASRDDDSAMRALRRMKAEASLLIAAADVGEVWDLAAVTRALTDVADTAVGASVRYLMRNGAKGRIKGVEHPERGSGYIVLALGKMGAYELNYSSDIDLIVFYDPESALPSGS